MYLNLLRLTSAEKPNGLVLFPLFDLHNQSHSAAVRWLKYRQRNPGTGSEIIFGKLIPMKSGNKEAAGNREGCGIPVGDKKMRKAGLLQKLRSPLQLLFLMKNTADCRHKAASFLDYLVPIPQK